MCCQFAKDIRLIQNVRVELSNLWLEVIIHVSEHSVDVSLYLTIISEAREVNNIKLSEDVKNIVNATNIYAMRR